MRCLKTVRDRWNETRREEAFIVNAILPRFVRVIEPTEPVTMMTSPCVGLLRQGSVLLSHRDFLLLQSVINVADVWLLELKLTDYVRPMISHLDDWVHYLLVNSLRILDIFMLVFPILALLVIVRLNRRLRLVLLTIVMSLRLNACYLGYLPSLAIDYCLCQDLIKSIHEVKGVWSGAIIKDVNLSNSWLSRRWKFYVKVVVNNSSSVAHESSLSSSWWSEYLRRANLNWMLMLCWKDVNLWVKEILDHPIWGLSKLPWIVLVCIEVWRITLRVNRECRLLNECRRLSTWIEAVVVVGVLIHHLALCVVRACYQAWGVVVGLICLLIELLRIILVLNAIVCNFRCIWLL
jgi:hypothetical protein